MHLNSENLITFITALSFYKYWVLLFELTNSSSFFQQYINDTLWDYLNDFCQVYLNDILIYSKTCKKHQTHIKLILQCFCEAELQVNIQKCKFDVTKTVFLDVIISEKGLHMNLNKIKAVTDWFILTNLKKV